MLAITDKKIFIVLNSGSPMEKASRLRKALLSLIKNIDVENHYDDLLGDLVEVSDFITQLEFNDEQSNQIQRAISGVDCDIKKVFELKAIL